MITLLKIISESVSQALGQLRANKLRSFLSLLGISIGIFCIIGVLSAVDSLESNVRGSLEKLGNDVLYVKKWPWANTSGDWWNYFRRPHPDFKDYERVKKKSKNAELTGRNNSPDKGKTPGEQNYFLPMAFAEGSPMHPAYGAGHATVAGACVTILKAFFDTSAVLVGEFNPDNPKDPENVPKAQFKSFAPGDQAIAFRAPDLSVSNNQSCENLVPYTPNEFLTLEGELNKLAANISIGRNMAGVHYFSDYYDSLRMGEKIAIGILEEQALTYSTDPFVLSLPTFDGEVIRIGRR